MKKRSLQYPDRLVWIMGGTGFIIGFLASLAGGNLILTSLKRGLYGFILLFIITWIIKYLLHSINLSKEELQAHSVEKDSNLGKNFDVSLPAEPHDTPPSASDFQPWAFGNGEKPTDEQIQNMAEAVRAMKE